MVERQIVRPPHKEISFSGRMTLIAPAVSSRIDIVRLSDVSCDVRWDDSAGILLPDFNPRFDSVHGWFHLRRDPKNRDGLIVALNTYALFKQIAE